MPLDREQAVFSVLDHLDEAILGSTDRVEVIPDDLDSLVVDRVHVELLAADDFCEQRFGLEEDAVNCLVAPAWLGVAGHRRRRGGAGGASRRTRRSPARRLDRFQG